MSSNQASSRLAQYTTRAQIISQLQQQQNQRSKSPSASSSSLLLPASRWLARKVTHGVIQPLALANTNTASSSLRNYHHAAAAAPAAAISISTINSDNSAPGSVCVRSDTSDGKRLANIARLKVFGGGSGSGSDNRPTTPTRNAVHINTSSSSLLMMDTSSTFSSASCTVTAITTIPKDHASASPGEVWVAWSNGSISILNESANKVLTTLPSIAATCGSIVEMITFYSGSSAHIHSTVVGSGGNSSSIVSLQERKRRFQQQQQAFDQHNINFSAAIGGSSTAHPASSSSATSTIADGTWLFGRNSKFSRSAVVVVTSSGTLLCIDSRTRALMFRVPPNQHPRTSLVKCATALTDDTRAILLLATEDCLVHALELTINEADNRHKKNLLSTHMNNNTSTQSGSKSNNAHHHQSTIVCVPRIIQVLSVCPPGVNVELECCPLSIATSTKLLRDSPVPTIFVGFLTGHACFFKLIFTGRTDLHSSQEILDPHINDDSYMLLYNQSTGMTLAHNFQDPVVKVIPIHHGGSSCITVSSSGACVFSIASTPPLQNNTESSSSGGTSSSCWNPIQRVENFNFHQGSFPIGGTALSSNEVVILLSDGGLRRLLVANPEPDDDDDDEIMLGDEDEEEFSAAVAAKNRTTTTTTTTTTNDYSADNNGQQQQTTRGITGASTESPLISPTRKRQHAAAKRRTVTTTATSSTSRKEKRVDPMTGHEYELEPSTTNNNIAAAPSYIDDSSSNIVSDNEEHQNNRNTTTPTRATAMRSSTRKSNTNENDTTTSITNSVQEQDFFPSPHSKDPRRTNTNNSTLGDDYAASYERGRLSGIIKGRPQRAFHDLSMSEETERMIQHQQQQQQRLIISPNRNAASRPNSPIKSQQQQQHGFWGNNNNNNNNSNTSNNNAQQQHNEARVVFNSSNDFVERAMLVADAIQRLRTAESNFRQALEFEQDSELGFMWHLHQSASLGKRFVKVQEEVMKPLYGLVALERETRMKQLVIPFFSSLNSLFVLQSVERRRAELAAAEREERKKILHDEDDQFYFLFYSLMSNFSPKRQSRNVSLSSPSGNNNDLLPSSSSSNNNNHAMTLLEKQIARERSKSEAVSRENEKLNDTIQTLQSLLREEQQKNATMSIQQDTISSRNKKKKQQRNITFSGLSSDDDDDEYENTPPPPPVPQPRQTVSAQVDSQKYQREALLLREQVTSLQEKLSNIEKTLIQERKEHERELSTVMESSRKQQQQQQQVAAVLSPSAAQNQQQIIFDLKRTLEDEQIRRNDVERSLGIVSAKLDKLISVAAQSEAESREHRVKAEALEERLKLTSAELQDTMKELAEMRRYEDLARKFEKEFTLRDEEYVRVLRERDMILQTSDKAVATVEEQQETIRELTRSKDMLRRSARKLLALCDIAISVGSEPPAMSSLRKFLRETMMECATLKKFHGMPQQSIEMIQSIYERSGGMQDHLFSPVNPSMVVLDKSEALDVMTSLRRALEE